MPELEPTIIETLEFESSGEVIKIYRCESNPRQHENLGSFFTRHLKHECLDEENINPDKEPWDWNEQIRNLRNENPGILILPIFINETQEILLSSTPWPMGILEVQLGFVSVSLETMMEYFHPVNDIKRLVENTCAVLNEEIQEYQEHLNDEVFSGELFDIDGKMVSFTGGFYGRYWADNGLIEALEELRTDK